MKKRNERMSRYSQDVLERLPYWVRELLRIIEKERLAISSEERRGRMRGDKQG